MVHFRKYHGLGNDYIVIDPKYCDLQLSKKQISLICDRNRGVGSDGILWGPFFDANKNIRVRIFNPDGSEAEKSGNGIRIFSRYLCEMGYVCDANFELNTKGGKVYVQILNEKFDLIRVNMGKPSFWAKDIPVKGFNKEVVNETISVEGKVYSATCLTIGNPHCVLVFEKVSKELAVNLGSVIENLDIFPNRTNVQFMRVVDKNTIQIEIWERGAGYTQASGSSSCAAACAAYKLGLTNRKIRVNMPGGELEIEILDDESVLMTGAVSGIMQGMFSDNFSQCLHQL